MGWLRHRGPKRGHANTACQTEFDAFTPLTCEFWEILGVQQSVSCLRTCYPEYWLDRQYTTRYVSSPRPGDWARAKDNARTALADALAQNSDATLAPTHPFFWCLRDYDIDEATERAVTASGLALPKTWKYWLHQRDLRAKFDRRPTAGDPDRWTLPEFWILAGNSDHRADQIVHCQLDFWLNRGLDWRSAKARADDACRTASVDEPTGKCDPLYWFHRGRDFDESTQAAICCARLFLPDTWPLAVQKRRLLESLGPGTAILPDGAVYVTGGMLTTQTRLAKRIRSSTRQPASTRPGSHRRRWGPLYLDAQTDARAACCVVGAPAADGSVDAGNALVLRLLMQSLLDVRWLVFDADSNLFPVMQAIRPNDSVRLLDPCDNRACSWDIARDADSPERALRVASALIPDDPRDPPTLVAIVRTLAAAAINVLNDVAPGDWALVHLLALLEPVNIETFMADRPFARDLFLTHLDASPAQAAEIHSFLDARLRPLRPLAAAMTHAQDRVSITDWLHSSDVLLLRENQGPDISSARTNQALIELAIQALLDPSLHPTADTWVFFHGLEQIGRLDCLLTLVRHGPAHNVFTVLSLGDIESLQRHYGPDATALVGHCGNYAFLGTNNPVTARWASEIIGTQEVVRLQQHEAVLDGDKSQGFAVARQVRPVVAPGELQQLPASSRHNGLVGYFKHNSQSPYRGEIAPDELFSQLLEPTPKETPALQSRPAEQFQFPTDTTNLLCHLGFPRPNSQVHTGWDASPTREPEDFDPDDFPRITPD